MKYETHGRKQVFLIAIESDTRLEKTVVSNYIRMAVAKYDRILARDPYAARYFDGGISMPNFHIEEINFKQGSEEVDTIRQSVEVISLIKKFTSKFFSEKVEKPEWTDQKF